MFARSRNPGSIIFPSLDGDDGDEHVERDGGEAVLLEEGHEEAEPDEDHHVHVLEH